jgi:SWI/SNF-related matrix-associated actin-dependent regulator of chromatin subfamily A-like protein 1
MDWGPFGIEWVEERRRFEARNGTPRKGDLKKYGWGYDGEAKRWYSLTAGQCVPFIEASVDDRTRALVDKSAAVLRASAAPRPTSPTSIPLPPGKLLYPFQEQGVAVMSGRPFNLLADDMGLGKTVQAIGLANVVRPASILVVCPPSLIASWVRHFREWLTVRVKICTDIPAGGMDGCAVVLSDAKVAKAAAGIPPIDFLILDEAHRFKNPDSLRTKAVFGAGRAKGIQAKRIVAISGTPMLSRPSDLWPFVRRFGLRGTDGRPLDWKTFHERYCDLKQREIRVKRGGRLVAQKTWDASGNSNLRELSVLLREQVMVRRLKGDVLTELPPKRSKLVVLAPEDQTQAVAVRRELAVEERMKASVEAALRQFDEAEKAFRDSRDEVAYKAAVKALSAAKQVAFEETAAARKLTAISKIRSAVEYVDLLLEDGAESVLVFGHHHEVIDGLASGLARHGVLILDGRTPVSERQALCDRFQGAQGMSPRVMVLGIHAAGVGLTLTRAGDVVFCEHDWTPGLVRQCEDRAHRIGREGEVLVHHLVLDGSIDCRVAQTLVSKESVARDALDAACLYVQAEE